MATVDKNFRIKNGLVVEGSTATVNGNDILTKNTQDGDSYIVSLIGGTATSANENNTVVKRDGFGNFAAGQIDLSSKLYTPEVQIQNAGHIYEDSALNIDSYSGYDINIYATQNVNITSQNADVVINPDGNAYLWSKTNDNQIATQGNVTTAYNNATGYTDTAILNLNLGSTYDAYGAASTVQSNLDDHISDTSTHGVTGDIVGTSDVQSLSNKTFTGQVNFQSGGGAGGTNNHIDVDNSTGKMIIESGYSLDLVSQNDVTILSYGSDIVLKPDGNAFIWNKNADSQIATQGYVDTAATNAENNAKGYADSLINDASATTTNVWSAYKTSSEIGVAVSNLVDSAPALLDTLNELAAAIADNPNYATDMATSLAAKQNTLTAGNGISLVSDTISTNLGTGLEHSVAGTIQINRSTVDGWYDAAGSATTAENNAKSYADGLASNYDAAGAASAAQSAAETTAQNALNDVLAGTTQFTEVKIDWMVTHVASYVYEPVDNQTVAYSWNLNKGASAKFLVRIKNGVHSQVSEVLLTRDDSNNIAITEYGIVTTNGILGDITAGMNGNNIELKVTPTHNTGTEVFVSGTLMRYTD